MRLILASTSPRRKELLALLEYPFEICVPAFVERLDPGRPPQEQAEAFALQKAASCAAGHSGAFILGSDTVIALDNAPIGKPRDPADAAAILRRLMGRDHHVCTAVALLYPDGDVRDVASAIVQVRMNRWDDARLASYVRTEECLGKAGAYSIQGAAVDLIESIEGDFTAAVGLPLRLVASMLTAHGLRPAVDIDALYRARPYPNWPCFA
jgi:septum formation protein